MRPASSTSCSQEVTDEGKLRYVIADVAFGIAGASAASALITYLFARRLSDVPPVNVSSDGKSARLVWQGRF